MKKAKKPESTTTKDHEIKKPQKITHTQKQNTHTHTEREKEGEKAKTNNIKEVHKNNMCWPTLCRHIVNSGMWLTCPEIFHQKKKSSFICLSVSIENRVYVHFPI